MAEAPLGRRPVLAATVLLRRHRAPARAFEAFGERFGVLVRQLYGSTETGMITANMSDDPVVDVRVGRGPGAGRQRWRSSTTTESAAAGG